MRKYIVFDKDGKPVKVIKTNDKSLVIDEEWTVDITDYENAIEIIASPFLYKVVKKGKKVSVVKND